MKFIFGVGPHKYFLALIISMSLILANAHALPPHHFADYQKRVADEAYSYPKDGEREVYPTGSSLPECSHACGGCFPCKRVMVSFKCSVESCPVVYRCLCKGKYYHVPSA